jgi:hypothetical protein
MVLQNLAAHPGCSDADIEPAVAPADLQTLLRQRIESLDIEQARADVRPFLCDDRTPGIWSPRCFQDLASRVECA